MRFKGKEGDEGINMVVDSSLKKTLFWKDRVLRRDTIGSQDSSGALDRELEDLDFLKGDITRSMVNGITSIEFLDRVQQLMVKEMATMVVVKLLG